MALSFDYKYYPFIALIPGYLLGDFIGAAASFLLVREYLSPRKTEISYELALLKLCSLLIKTDGSVHKDEINFVRKFFIKTFGKSKSERLFNELKTKNVPSNIDELIKVLKNKLTPSKYYSVIQFLFAIAVVDGVISKGENDFIYSFADGFGFSKERVDQIKNQFTKNKNKSSSNKSSSNKSYSPEIISNLNVLGLKTGCSLDDIKKAYRNLAKEYHPDRLNGLSEGIKNLAKEKFQEIQSAYEFLIKNYV